MAFPSVVRAPPSVPNEVESADQGRHAVLVVTHAPGRKDLGKQIQIPERGLTLGGTGSDVQIDDAETSGSRLEIRWLGLAADGAEQWQALPEGQVTFNREPASQRMLRSRDDIRVVDTCFLFLVSNDLPDGYHVAIYHMTIVDMPTGLHNGRYLGEAVPRDISRSLRHGWPFAALVLEFDPPAEGSGTTSHALLGEAAARIRGSVPRDWCAGRTAELEIVIAAAVSATELEGTVRDWLRGCVPAVSRVGVAELGGPLQDAPALLAAARTNAR